MGERARQSFALAGTRKCMTNQWNISGKRNEADEMNGKKKKKDHQP